MFAQQSEEKKLPKASEILEQDTKRCYCYSHQQQTDRDKQRKEEVSGPGKSHQAHEHRSLQERVRLLLRDPRYSCHNPSLNCSGAKGWQRPGKVSSKMGSAEVTYKTWSGRAGYRKLQIHKPPFLMPLLCIHLKGGQEPENSSATHPALNTKSKTAHMLFGQYF